MAWIDADAAERIVKRTLAGAIMAVQFGLTPDLDRYQVYDPIADRYVGDGWKFTKAGAWIAADTVLESKGFET